MHPNVERMCLKIWIVWKHLLGRVTFTTNNGFLTWLFVKNITSCKVGLLTSCRSVVLQSVVKMLTEMASSISCLLAQYVYERLLSFLSFLFQGRKKDHVASLRVWHSDKPLEQKDVSTTHYNLRRIDDCWRWFCLISYYIGLDYHWIFTNNIKPSSVLFMDLWFFSFICQWSIFFFYST